MNSRSLFQNKCSKVDGMESSGRREIRHPPSMNTRYSAMLYNVEELNEQDVHELITVPGMADMQSQITEEWPTRASTSFEQEHKASGD